MSAGSPDKHEADVQSSTSSASPGGQLETLTDAELYLALQQGETEALGVLYNRHAGLVYGISLKVLSNPQAAEDLTQDIFLTLVRTQSYDEQRGSLRTYLAILTRSRAIDRLRSKGSANKAVNRWYRQQDHSPQSALPLEQATQRETRSEQSQQVKVAMSQLSPEEQQILRLMYFEGQSQSMISRSLGIPLGTVKTRSRRGLIKLRGLLKVPIPLE